MKNGVLAGYPLDSLKVVLKDGSFHPVDSDQLSFEICAIQAYKNACAKAGPVLTEPIMKLEVVTPEENMGDVIGDLNKRRGQVEGMESSRSGARIVKAKVPLAEMFGYVTALRTITSGRATSSMTYDHHAQVSSSIAKAVLEEVPTHKRIFTVNRSTFVNKKSREQFELSSYKRLIDIYSSTAKTVDALMKLELPSGVEVEIKV